MGSERIRAVDPGHRHVRCIHGEKRSARDAPAHPAYGIHWEGDGLVAVRPETVFAWKFESFNTTATRFALG